MYVFFVKAILKCLNESDVKIEGSYRLKLKNLLYLHLVCLQAFFSRLLMLVCYKTSGVVSKPTQVAQFQVMSQHLLFCSILLMKKGAEANMERKHSQQIFKGIGGIELGANQLLVVLNLPRKIEKCRLQPDQKGN